MPPKAVRSQLVPNSFHRDLIAAMEAIGLVRMYQFIASTDRDEYYVPADYAQRTSHFFYFPEHGFVLQLELNEVIDEFGYHCWWSGAVYLQLDVKAMVEYEVNCRWGQLGRPTLWEDEEPLDRIMGNLGELLKPFRDRGTSRLDDEYGSFGWTLEYPNQLTVEQLATFADGLRTHFGPFLKPTLSHDFSAFCFTNTYAWPGIDEQFWRGFPTRLLKELVPGRIRGRESARTQHR